MRKNNVLHPCKQGIIAGRPFPALLIPLCQMFELETEKPGLDRIQPPVIAFKVVGIFLRLAVIAKHANCGRELIVICSHRASLATGAQVLAWIKTKGCRFSNRSCSSPSVLIDREVLRSLGLA